MAFEDMTVAELKDLLRERDLPVSGRKADLIIRLNEVEESPVQAEPDEASEAPLEGELDDAEDEDYESEDAEEYYEGDFEEWDDFHTARQKPVLDDATKEALATRAAQKKKQPAFRRQEWFRYKRLSRTGWKKPRGDDSSQRKNRKYRSPMVRVGYGKIADARGLHPSGFEEVRINTPKEIENVDPKTQAIRIARTVGDKKREIIVQKADEMGIRVFNRRDL